MATVDRVEVELSLRIDDLKRQLNLATSEFKRETAKMSGAVDSINKSTKNLSDGLRGLGGVIATAFSVNALKNFGTEAVRTSFRVEGVQAALKNIVGSASAARAEMNYLSAVTNQLGVNTLNAASSYSNLLAAAKAQNIELSTARQVFQSVTEASAAFQLSSQDTEGAMRALTQMFSKGKISMEELTGQLGERISIALGSAARGMNMTTEELIALTSSGKLSIRDFALPFAKALHEDVAGALDEVAGSPKAAIGRLVNSLEMARSEMGFAISNTASFAAILNSLGQNAEGTVEVFAKITMGFDKFLMTIAEAGIHLLAFIGILDKDLAKAASDEATERLAKAQKNLDDRFKKTNDTLVKDSGGGYVGAVEELTKKQKDAIRETEKFTESLNKMVVSAQRDARDFGITDLQKDLNGLNDFIMDNAEQFKKLGATGKAEINKIRDSIIELNSKKVLDESIKKQKEATEAMQKEYEHMLENIHDRFADTFEGIFSGQVNDWSDLLDSMKGLFFRFLAEMAAKSAVTSLAPAFGLTGIGSGAALGGGGGSMSGVGSLLSQGASKLGIKIPGLGGGGIGQMIDVIGGKIGFGGVVGAGGPMLPGTGAGALTGSSLSSVLGVSSLGSMAAGMFGLGSGNMFVDTALGAVGGTAGSAIGGMLGSAGGPIGTAIGSFLGTAIGGAFGGKKPNPASQFLLSSTSGGGFDIANSASKHMGTEFADGLSSSIQQMVMALQSSYGTKLQSGTRIFGGFNTKNHGGKGFIELPDGSTITFDENSVQDTQKAMNALGGTLLKMGGSTVPYVQNSFFKLINEGETVAKAFEQLAEMEKERAKDMDIINKLKTKELELNRAITESMTNMLGALVAAGNAANAAANDIMNQLMELRISDVSPYSQQQQLAFGAELFRSNPEQYAASFAGQSRSFYGGGTSEYFNAFQGIESALMDRAGAARAQERNALEGQAIASSQLNRSMAASATIQAQLLAAQRQTNAALQGVAATSANNSFARPY